MPVGNTQTTTQIQIKNNNNINTQQHPHINTQHTQIKQRRNKTNIQNIRQ